MYRFAIFVAILVVLEAGCALTTDKPQGVKDTLVGEWKTIEFKSSYEEFIGVTNLTFCVYEIEIRSTNYPPSSFWAKVVGEFLVKGEDGQERLPYPCFPMFLCGTNELLAGPLGDGLVFRYAFTNGLLVLESIEGGVKFFSAKLKRIKEHPGEPRILPDWAR